MSQNKAHISSEYHWGDSYNLPFFGRWGTNLLGLKGHLGNIVNCFFILLILGPGWLLFVGYLFFWLLRKEMKVEEI